MEARQRLIWGDDEIFSWANVQHSGNDMRYTGVMTDMIGIDDEGYVWQVTEAIVTLADIKIDWIEAGERAHLQATSTDGVSYDGTFGYPLLDSKKTMVLKRYIADDGEMLLLGH